MGTGVFYGVGVGNDIRTRYPVAVIINIKDDEPVVEFGNPAGSAIESGDTYEGDWHCHFGADGAAPAESLVLTVRNELGEWVQLPVEIGARSAVVINGTPYGAITLKADYSFVFECAPNISETLSFVLTAVDSDGDRSNSDAFSLVVSTPPPPPVEHLETWVSEAELPGGTSAGAATAKVIDLPAGYLVDIAGWADAGHGLVTLKNRNGVG